MIPLQPDRNCSPKVLAAIETVVPFEKSRFVRCPVTAQVRIAMHSDNTNWVLHSLDENGNQKTVGGDEYYITYTDAGSVTTNTPTTVTHATAVARALDQNNGTYILDFVSSVLDQRNSPNLVGRGTLSIHFEYTCGVGRMGQPMKDAWNSAGYTHTHYTVRNVTMPPFRVFQPPVGKVALNNYESVFVLGDSVMANFVGRSENFFGKKNLYQGRNPELALNTHTVDAWLSQLLSEYGSMMRNSSTTGRKAVLLGSSTWDILRNNVDQWMTWNDHKEACRKLITSIRQEFPSVEVLWKSASAIHICNANVEEMAVKSHYWGVERVRYMSESRSYDIHVVQKALMKELQVPVLDVYEATFLSADQSRSPTDARHYNSRLNKVMLNWFYKGN